MLTQYLEQLKIEMSLPGMSPTSIEWIWHHNKRKIFIWKAVKSSPSLSFYIVFIQSVWKLVNT